MPVAAACCLWPIFADTCSLDKAKRGKPEGCVINVYGYSSHVAVPLGIMDEISLTNVTRDNVRDSHLQQLFVVTWGYLLASWRR